MKSVVHSVKVSRAAALLPESIGKIHHIFVTRSFVESIEENNIFHHLVLWSVFLAVDDVHDKRLTASVDNRKLFWVIERDFNILRHIEELHNVGNNEEANSVHREGAKKCRAKTSSEEL